MKRRRRIIQNLYVLVLLSICLSLLFGNRVSATEGTRQLDIETSPDKVLYKLSNLKPGDWAKKKLTIQNRGEIDFTYNTEVKFKGGSKKLYNEYLLKVWDSNRVLFEGKLQDFNGHSPRLLRSMVEEDLMFQVEFPYELGNEFQRLGFEFELIFMVEDYTSYPPPETPGEPVNPGPDPEKPVNPEHPDLEKPVTPESPNEENDTEPSNPETPSDPQEPDEPVLNPPHPIDPDTLNSPPTDGQILPATSTNIYNFILGGAVLLLAGASILYLSRKRNLDTKG